MFSSLLVCLYVCLSVRNITDKRINGFSWKFRDRWDLVHRAFWDILGMFHCTPQITQDFSRKSRVCDQHCGKLWNGFSFNFPDTSNIKQGTIWNILMIMHLTLCVQGCFWYFRDTYLLATLQEKKVNRFSWNFEDMSEMTQQKIWLNCFTPD